MDLLGHLLGVLDPFAHEQALLELGHLFSANERGATLVLGGVWLEVGLQDPVVARNIIRRARRTGERLAPDFAVLGADAGGVTLVVEGFADGQQSGVAQLSRSAALDGFAGAGRRQGLDGEELFIATLVLRGQLVGQGTDQLGTGGALSGRLLRQDVVRVRTVDTGHDRKELRTDRGQAAADFRVLAVLLAVEGLPVEPVDEVFLGLRDKHAATGLVALVCPHLAHFVADRDVGVGRVRQDAEVELAGVDLMRLETGVGACSCG